MLRAAGHDGGQKIQGEHPHFLDLEATTSVHICTAASTMTTLIWARFCWGFIEVKVEIIPLGMETQYSSLLDINCDAMSYYYSNRGVNVGKGENVFKPIGAC